jgi:hypothetical protein
VVDSNRSRRHSAALASVETRGLPVRFMGGGFPVGCGRKGTEWAVLVLDIIALSFVCKVLWKFCLYTEGGEGAAEQQTPRWPAHTLPYTALNKGSIEKNRN